MSPLLALAASTGTATSGGQAAFFWLFALGAIGGAVGMITRKNAVAAVMCLVGTVVSLAALYVMLFAHFIAAIQVLVYAGAIMVLFVFVVMILNKEEAAPWAVRGWFGKGLAGLSLVYFLIRLGGVAWSTVIKEAAWSERDMLSYGTTKAVGKELFGSYLFPFEAVSLVLLIAVVGALVLSRPGQVPHE